MRPRLLLAALLLVSHAGCPDWESPADLSPPQVDLDSPPSLEPGSPLRISRGPAQWASQGWFRLTPRPEERPEVWTISGGGVRLRALVIAGDGPAAVVLPHLQGTTRIPEYVARRFAREGYQVVAQLPPEAALEAGSTREAMLEVMRQRIKEGRAAARIAARELGAPCRVLVGVSVGGMVAIPVAALEGDIDGVVSMLAGGGMGWIVDHSKEPLIQPSPIPRGEAPSAPAEAQAAALVDPLTWAPRLRKDRVLMIRAVWDQVIPPPATHALWDALGQPEIHAYPSGHYSFGVFLPHAVDRALERADAWCRQAEGRATNERAKD